MENEEILKYMLENTHLTGYAIAKHCNVPNPRVYNLAEKHNIVLAEKSPKKRNTEGNKQRKIEQGIRDNPTLSSREIGDKIGEKDVSWIGKIAKDIGIELPKSKIGRRPGSTKPKKEEKTKPSLPEKKFKEPGSHKKYTFNKSIKEEKEEEWLEEDAGEVAERSANQRLIEADKRRKEIRDNRPKGEYTQSTSPYGLTEEFGLSAKTKK